MTRRDSWNFTTIFEQISTKIIKIFVSGTSEGADVGLEEGRFVSSQMCFYELLLLDVFASF